ncbi:MAG TPA: hypothetical protein VFU69_16840 [Ktedonobacterales bacterium]|nr:hypothetical protein [Ktedonobacterales bacterium]
MRGQGRRRYAGSARIEAVRSGAPTVGCQGRRRYKQRRATEQPR